MKKIFIAILGAAVLCASCAKDLYIEQNPFRSIVEYTPGSVSMAVSGTLTPDASYDWITVSQSGDNATFTYRRNTSGVIRRAEFTQSGSSQKCIINQKAHGLDASVSATLAGQTPGTIALNMGYSTSFPDDYDNAWGIVYSKTSDRGAGKEVPQNSAIVDGKATGSITGLEEGVDYFVWTYVVSTEGDRVYSPMLAVLPPVYVKEVCDLQAVLDAAKEFQEIRLLGGLTFNGPVNFFDNNKNKSISGGWNADFTEQSMDNLTVMDGQGKTRGFQCAADANDQPLKGAVTISYMEVKNCNGGHGSGIHICGGPLTVHHCFFHDNNGDKGSAVGTREEDYSSDMNVYNCIFDHNLADSGHGACLGLGDGASNDDPVHATVVSNLFINNRSDKFGGYASIFICYNHTELIFVNNTVVNNFNYMDGEDLYSGMMFRGNTRNLLANNIIVGNTISVDKLMPPVETPHPNYINLGGSFATLANNIIESNIRENQNMTASDNQMFDAGFDYSAVLDSQYQPKGTALGAGTLGKYTISFNDGKTNEVSVKDVLGKYDKDLAGNPRVTNGKVDLGCYQAQ